MMLVTVTIVVLWIMFLSMLRWRSKWAVLGEPVTIGLILLISFRTINFVPLIYCVLSTFVLSILWALIKRIFSSD